ncbi:MAG TPA: pitrilysin family protein [Blastocatellia bacterium]|nr:pitrilysin family protein [Blastocatellia bacterium]
MKQHQRTISPTGTIAVLTVLILTAIPVDMLAGQRRPVARELPPKAGPIKPFAFPAIREKKLQNGLAVMLVEDHRAPIVTFNMAVNAGDVRDPSGLEGLAEATADLLTQGAGSRTARELAEEVESIGGRISSSSNDDYSEITFAVIAENLDRMLDIVGDVVLRPTFPEKEIDLLKSNRTESLKVERQDPGFLAGEQFHRVVYGPHPYSVSSPTPESIASIDRTKIESFYRSAYVPTGSIVVVIGDFDSSAVEQKLRGIFGDWKAPGAGQPRFPSPPPPGRRILLIDRPGSDQADIRIGNVAVTRSDPDFFPLLVANSVLGAGTASRLFLNVREQKGYAYDVGSSLSIPREMGTFYGYTQTRTEVAVKAIQEILREFTRMRTQMVSPRDLQNAKNYLNGLFSLTLSTQGGLADRLSSAYMFGLGKAYLEEYRSRVAAVTSQRVLQAAQRHILTDRVAIIVVGDAAKLKQPLSAMGRVELFDIEGRHLSADGALNRRN